MFKKNKKVDEMYRQEPVAPVCNCCEVESDIFQLTECKLDEERTVIVDALTCQGKELKVSVQFNEVCRRYALAVSVFVGYPQMDPEVPTTMDVYAYKICLVPAGEEPVCEALTVDGFCFDLVEDICSDLYLPIKVVAHYVFDRGQFTI